MHKKDFFPFYCFQISRFSLSYLEPQIISPFRDIGPATATLDLRPRHWSRDRALEPQPRPATRDPRPLLKLAKKATIFKVIPEEKQQLVEEKDADNTWKVL